MGFFPDHIFDVLAAKSTPFLTDMLDSPLRYTSVTVLVIVIPEYGSIFLLHWQIPAFTQFL